MIEGTAKRIMLLRKQWAYFALSLLMLCISVSLTRPCMAASPAKKKAKAPVVRGASSLDKSLSAARMAMVKGDIAAAMTKLSSARGAAEKSGNVGQQIECLEMICECLESQGKLPESKPLRQKAIDMAQKKFGAESAEYAAALAGMSCYFTRKGNNAQAWNFIEKANAALGNAGGSYDNPLAGASCSMATARIQTLEGNRGLADGSFKKALELRESKLKAEDPFVLLVCKEYAKLLEQLERKSEADALRSRITVASAVGTGEDTETMGKGKVSGSNEFKKVVDAAKQAADLKDYDVALTNWQKAAQIAEKGGRKQRLAYALLHIGDMYSMKGQKDKVAAFYNRSKALREESNATNTVGMARNLVRLSNVAMWKKNYAEAKKLLTLALSTADKCGAGDRLLETTLRSLSSACMVTKDFGQGEQVCKRLVSLAEKGSGPSAGTKKAMAVSMLAGIYMQTGRTQQGLAMMKSVSGQMSPAATRTYGEATKSEYIAMEKEIDAAEEKRLSIN